MTHTQRSHVCVCVCVCVCVPLCVCVVRVLCECVCVCSGRISTVSLLCLVVSTLRMNTLAHTNRRMCVHCALLMLLLLLHRNSLPLKLCWELYLLESSMYSNLARFEVSVYHQLLTFFLSTVRAHTHTYTHSFTHTLSLSLVFSLSHAHTHSHTHLQCCTTNWRADLKYQACPWKANVSIFLERKRERGKEGERDTHTDAHRHT